MRLTKKQVKGVLNVLKTQVKGRPVLSNLIIDYMDNEVRLGFTNSYIVGSWKLTGCDGLIGKGITYESLEIWYKLSKPNAVIDDLWIMANAVMIEGEDVYPKLDRYVPVNKPDVPLARLAINAEYLNTLQTIAGGYIQMYFGGELSAILCECDDFLGVILPVRIEPSRWTK